MVRDWTRLRYTAAGGEGTVTFASLAVAIPPDALDVIRLTRNGADLDIDTLTITTDASGYGTDVSWDVPGGFDGDYAIGAGEWFDMWYLGETILAHPGAATKSAIVDAAMDLVRSPEGLSVTVDDISDAYLQVACEASYYDLMVRFAAQIPTVASLSAVDSGTGSDVYHFARAVGFLTSARLVNGVTKGGGIKKLTADDGAIEYFGQSEDAADAAALGVRCERELSLVSLIATLRTAATMTLFGVAGPRRARQESTTAPWTLVVRELLG